MRWIIQKITEEYLKWFWEKYGGELRKTADREAIKAYVWLWVQYHVILLFLSQSLERPEAVAELSDEDHTAELKAELAEIAKVLRGFTPSQHIASRLNEQFSAISKIGRIPRVSQFAFGMDPAQMGMKGLMLGNIFQSINREIAEATRISGLGSASLGMGAMQHLQKYKELTNGITTAAGPFGNIHQQIAAVSSPFKGIDAQVAEAAKKVLGGKSQTYTMFGAIAKAGLFKEADTTAALTKDIVGSKSRIWMDFGAKPGADFFKGTNTGIASKLGAMADWRELTGTKSGISTFLRDEDTLRGNLASYQASYFDSVRKDLSSNLWNSTAKQMDTFNKEIAFGMRPIHKQIAEMEKQMRDARKGLMFPPRFPPR